MRCRSKNHWMIATLVCMHIIYDYLLSMSSFIYVNGLCMYATAQRQHCSCSLSIEYIAFELIKQLPVTCINSSTSLFYAWWLQPLTIEHESARFSTSYHKLLGQIKCYLLNRMQVKVMLSLSDIVVAKYNAVRFC